MKSTTIATILVACSILATAEDKKLSDPIVGTADEKGNLALHIFDSGGKPQVARLTTEYGVVMFHSKDDWVLFVLGERTKKQVREFSEYDDLLAALDDVPVDSEITIYDRCKVPRFYDFYPVHYELFKKFKRDCGDRGLTIAKEPNITCTCEEGGPR